MQIAAVVVAVNLVCFVALPGSRLRPFPDSPPCVASELFLLLLAVAATVI
jgi:hypothetical protein